MENQNASSTPIQKTGLNFGQALELIKQGKSVQREGWNGKGMFVFLNRGSSTVFTNEPNQLIDGIPCSLFDNGAHGTITRVPNMCIKMATGSIGPWNNNNLDALAEDWQIVD